MNYLPITKSALSKVGDLPFTADLVGADDMNALEREYRETLKRVIQWTEKEKAVLDQLAKDQGLTIRQILRQSLRHYQMNVVNRSEKPASTFPFQIQVLENKVMQLAEMNENQKAGLEQIAREAGTAPTSFGDVALEVRNIRNEYAELSKVVVEAYCRISDHLSWARHLRPQVGQIDLLRAVDALVKPAEVSYANPPVKHPEVKPLQERFGPESSWTKASNEIHDKLVASGVDPYAPVEVDAPSILPTPPPGHQWHREDGWGPDDFKSKSMKHPGGYRPLLLGEKEQPEDEYKSSDSGEWVSSSSLTGFGKVQKHWNHRRTRRPLKFSFLGKEWTWYSGKGPIPTSPDSSDPGSMIWLLYRNGSQSTACYAPEIVNTSSVIGWRFADPLYEFKKAHKEGKTVQVFGNEDWESLPGKEDPITNSISHSFWNLPPSHYRVIEDAPPSHPCQEVLISEPEPLALHLPSQEGDEGNEIPPGRSPSPEPELDDGEEDKTMEDVFKSLEESEEEVEPDSESFLKEWEKWVSETATYFDCGGGDITYPLLGLVGELGELVNSIVKYYRKADLITLKINDLPANLRKKLKDESYDALHFLMFLLIEQGITLEEIIHYGKTKLEKRMEEGTVHKENRISGSIVGKRVSLTDDTRVVEAEVYQESPKYVVVKSDVHVKHQLLSKIEIMEDQSSPANKKRSKWVVHIPRTLFYSLLR